ncbi:hypothetical protein HBI25_187920 [Parastagonospora nodorum]|nr:hypothetical protein HBH53_182240 [Parastagonospora nodorum]KAH3964481.1 hypothetical protein HBH51_158350 [Parastagonospora nodorum]KAH4132850.1 hypothetical protein HBH47_002040 [Parastagonospora nodorum]KAH4187890.1 hypothetical protein HBH42_151600 [Parastagonospora nodorum]KAH4260611.1 hypothetical protein HBI03_126500 [Parastagonospora nodorum]
MLLHFRNLWHLIGHSNCHLFDWLHFRNAEDAHMLTTPTNLLDTGDSGDQTSYEAAVYSLGVSNSDTTNSNLW